MRRARLHLLRCWTTVLAAVVLVAGMQVAFLQQTHCAWSRGLAHASLVARADRDASSHAYATAADADARSERVPLHVDGPSPCPPALVATAPAVVSNPMPPAPSDVVWPARAPPRVPRVSGPRLERPPRRA
jgi:hypothetical protein